MTPRRVRLAALLLVALALGCGSTGRAPYSLDVGTDDSGPPSQVLGSGDASGGGPLDAHIENSSHMTVTFVTLSCADKCAVVEAVATGGNEPYSFSWDDGSTNPQRQVCPTSTTNFHVKVTDTATTGEIPRPAETAQASLTAGVIACPDGGAMDAGPDAMSCVVAGGGGPLDTITPDINDNAEAFFANGASLPAGRYEIRYAGGSVNYSACCGTWTVNGEDGQYEYLIVGATTSDRIAIAPGTFAIVLTPGAAPGQSFANAADCVAANLMDPPYDFDFAGGKLGIYNNDFEPADNAPGPGVGAPSFTLSQCQ